MEYTKCPQSEIDPRSDYSDLVRLIEDPKFREGYCTARASKADDAMKEIEDRINLKVKEYLKALDKDQKKDILQAHPDVGCIGRGGWGDGAVLHPETQSFIHLEMAHQGAPDEFYYTGNFPEELFLTAIDWLYQRVDCD